MVRIEMKPLNKVNSQGGYRPGSGQPRKNISEKELMRLIRAVKQTAKERGSTWHKRYAELMFDDLASIKDRISAFKVFMDFVIRKETEQNITVSRQEEPAISLPALEDDPGLTVVSGGKG